MMHHSSAFVWQTTISPAASWHSSKTPCHASRHAQRQCAIDSETALIGAMQWIPLEVLKKAWTSTDDATIVKIRNKHLCYIPGFLTKEVWHKSIWDIAYCKRLGVKANRMVTFAALGSTLDNVVSDVEQSVFSTIKRMKRGSVKLASTNIYLLNKVNIIVKPQLWLKPPTVLSLLSKSSFMVCMILHCSLCQ